MLYFYKKSTSKTSNVFEHSDSLIVLLGMSLSKSLNNSMILFIFYKCITWKVLYFFVEILIIKIHVVIILFIKTTKMKTVRVQKMSVLIK